MNPLGSQTARATPMLQGDTRPGKYGWRPKSVPIVASGS